MWEKGCDNFKSHLTLGLEDFCLILRDGPIGVFFSRHLKCNGCSSHLRCEVRLTPSMLPITYKDKLSLILFLPLNPSKSCGFLHIKITSLAHSVRCYTDGGYKPPTTLPLSKKATRESRNRIQQKDRVNTPSEDLPSQRSKAIDGSDSVNTWDVVCRAPAIWCHMTFCWLSNNIIASQLSSSRLVEELWYPKIQSGQSDACPTRNGDVISKPIALTRIRRFILIYGDILGSISVLPLYLVP